MIEKRIITYMAILCHIIFSIKCSPISYKEKSCNKGTFYQCNCKSCWKEFEMRNETEKFLNWVQIELINCPNEQEIKTFDDLIIRKRIANWINEECALVLDCNKIGITKRINEKDVIIGGSIECSPLGGQLKINVIGKGNHLTKENIVPADILVQILQAREHLLSYIIGIDLISISTISNNNVYSHHIGNLNEIHFDMFEDNKNEIEDSNYENEDEYDDDDDGDDDEEEDYGHDDKNHYIQKINIDDNQTNNITLDEEETLFTPSITTTKLNISTKLSTKSYNKSSKHFIEENDIITTSTSTPSIITNTLVVSNTTSIIDTKLPNSTLYPHLLSNLDEIPNKFNNNNNSYDTKIYTNKPSSTLTFNNISIDIPEWLTISLITILTTLLLILCIISCITYLFVNCRTGTKKISKDKANKCKIIKRQEEKNEITRLEENSNVEKMLLDKVGTGII